MTVIKIIDRWTLFWLVAGPVSVAMLLAMLQTDLESGEGISALIQLSVRCAVPLLYIVFAASAFQALFPGRFGRWLLRNRKYLGLSFAAAMAWQAFFILWLVIGHTRYYVDEVYVLRDAIEGTVGYTLLAAMTVTSFPWGRRHLSQRQWRALHLTGIYFLWAYAFTVYWWELFYYPDPVPLDFLYYWGGLAAWLLRAAAWGKRRSTALPVAVQTSGKPLVLAAGIALTGTGLAIAGFGSAWQQTAAEVLYGYGWTTGPETWLPYWPFEPFLPLAAILGGIYLVTQSRTGVAPQAIRGN